jgi:hypothetical protein
VTNAASGEEQVREGAVAEGVRAASEVRVFIVFIYSTLVLGLEMVASWARF